MPRLIGTRPFTKIGKFFSSLGYDFLNFTAAELSDISRDLYENVMKYIPVRTGLLKSKTTATATNNRIEVYSAVKYAVWVEVGVFGKDKSRLVKTADYGGMDLVRSPNPRVTEIEDFYNVKEGERLPYEARYSRFFVKEDYNTIYEAQKIVNGWAQYMRAALWDTFPLLIKHFRRIIDHKIKKNFLKLSGRYG